MSGNPTPRRRALDSSTSLRSDPFSKIRIEYAGAAFNVMARGDQGRAIYADECDRKLWLATLGEACENTGWRIHAWVMMNDHYHLLL